MKAAICFNVRRLRASDLRTQHRNYPYVHTITIRCEVHLDRSKCPITYTLVSSSFSRNLSNTVLFLKIYLIFNLQILSALRRFLMTPTERINTTHEKSDTQSLFGFFFSSAQFSSLSTFNFLFIFLKNKDFFPFASLRISLFVKLIENGLNRKVIRARLSVLLSVKRREKSEKNRINRCEEEARRYTRKKIKKKCCSFKPDLGGVHLYAEVNHKKIRNLLLRVTQNFQLSRSCAKISYR